jgi:hypothetical protein
MFEFIESNPDVDEHVASFVFRQIVDGIEYVGKNISMCLEILVVVQCHLPHFVCILLRFAAPKAYSCWYGDGCTSANC